MLRKPKPPSKEFGLDNPCNNMHVAKIDVCITVNEEDFQDAID